MILAFRRVEVHVPAHRVRPAGRILRWAALVVLGAGLRAPLAGAQDIDFDVNPRSGALQGRIPVYTLQGRGGTSVEFAFVYNSDLWAYQGAYSNGGVGFAQAFRDRVSQVEWTNRTQYYPWILVDSIPRFHKKVREEYEEIDDRAWYNMYRYRLYIDVGGSVEELLQDVATSRFFVTGITSEETYWAGANVWKTLNGELEYHVASRTLLYKDGTRIVYDTFPGCSEQPCFPSDSGVLTDRNGNQWRFTRSSVTDPDGRSVDWSAGPVRLPDGNTITPASSPKHVNTESLVERIEVHVRSCEKAETTVSQPIGWHVTTGAKQQKWVLSCRPGKWGILQCRIKLEEWRPVEVNVLSLPSVAAQVATNCQDVLPTDGDGWFHQNVQALTSLTLPDGRSFVFQYNSFPLVGDGFQVTELSGRVRTVVDSDSGGGLASVTDLALVSVRLPHGGLVSLTYGDAKPNRTQQGQAGPDRFQDEVSWDHRPVLSITRDPILGAAIRTAFEYLLPSFESEYQRFTTTYTDNSRLLEEREPRRPQELWRSNQLFRETFTDPAGRVLWQRTHDYTGTIQFVQPAAAAPPTPRTLEHRSVTTVHDPQGANLQTTRSYAYDTFHNVRAETLTEGARFLESTETEYVTDPAYLTRRLVSLPRSVTRIGTDGETVVTQTTHEYDLTGRQDASGAPNLDPGVGDQRGNPTRTTTTYFRQEGPPVASETTYYQTGDVASVTDPRGAVSRYDLQFKPCTAADRSVTTTIRNALQHVVRTERDCLTGNVLSETDANGRRTVHTYDGLGRPLTTQVPGDSGATTWTDYFLFGSNANTGGTGVFNVGDQRTVVHTRDGSRDGLVVKHFLDGLGREIQVRSEADRATAAGESPNGPALERVTSTEYDNRGNVSRTYLPRFEVAGNAYVAPPPGALFHETERDAIGRVTSERRPGLLPTTTRYDGYVATSVHANDPGVPDTEERATRTTVDALSRKVKEERRWLECADPCPCPDRWCATTYAFDPASHVETITDPRGSVISLTYDGLGRLLAMTDPDMGGFADRSWSYKYDANGNLVEQVDAKGQKITFEHDPLNRIKVKDLPPAGPGPEDVTYFYDGQGPTPPGGGGAGSASATFVRLDTTTAGTWKGTYGADGYQIAGDSQSLPVYAPLTLSGHNDFVWGSTDEARALQKAAGPDRIAACWYSGTSFTIDVNLTDGQAHQMALYALDWDSWGGGRSQTIQVADAGNGAILDTRSISAFSGGQYLVWTVKGHVVFRVTNDNPSSNALIGGVFFGGGSGGGGGGTASFVRIDTSTQGSWKGAYGGDGAVVLADSQNLPGYAQVSASGQSDFVWAGSTGDVRALQKAASGLDRIAACWYSGTSLTIDVSLTDGQTHQVALYVLDWDSYGPRRQTIEVLDAGSGTVLDTRAVTAFQGGQYLVWNVKGHVMLRVRNDNAGYNAVVNGLFFGGAGGGGSAGGSANFVREDTSTGGSWRGSYGADGHVVVGDSQSVPAYAQVIPGGQSEFLWSGSTGDLRALQKASGADRLAACWYSGTSFTIDVKLTDGQAHPVALYALDWDSYGPRRQTIQVVDPASGTVLDTRTVTDFQSGRYLVWNVQGHVRFRITNDNPGYNAVVSGLFFGGAGGGGGSGTGLRGEYFQGTTLEGAVVLTRVDPILDFNWGGGSPDVSLPVDQFSVRWTGEIEAPASGSYTFHVFSDDGVRLWVNGQLVLDRWFDQWGPEAASAAITLEPGRRYPVKVEHYESAGGAELHLSWSGPSTPKQTVPKARLYPSS